MTAHQDYEAVHNIYRSSFDIFRVICISLIIVIEFGLDFIPFLSFIQPFLYFSQGALFTIYGYIVLRDGADLRKNILHTLKVFVILFVVYGALTAGYCYLMTGNPFAVITKRSIFNFVVLNVWPTTIGASIWYVQATLYSLIIFWIFRRFKNFDWLFCIILFAAAILLGEFAGLIHFDFLGYSYIPGNFLTRAMPYMLLGRLIDKYYKKITSKLYFGPFIYFFIGFILCVIEYFVLGFSGNLVYPNHFIGFILMSASMCILCVCRPYIGTMSDFCEYAPTVYKGMFYVYNPMGYIFLFVAGLLCQTAEQYYICQCGVGIMVVVLSMIFSMLVVFLKNKLNAYKKYKRRK